MIQVGEVLDKYELLERVGQGGMAIVYRGLDRSLKRVVAVKILHKHLSDYQEARDRFEREAQAVAKLRHENILEIFDYSGADDAKAAGSSYIVTEFIDGMTLKQAVTDRPLQFPELGAMIVLQICRALAHAHGAGILHRDVKPENVMIRADGVVKLMDFGISHMLDLERLTVTGQLLGSPAYMAPEHVEGRQLDFRTDVFAAGIVLYQLTVGKLPFEGKNPHEVLKRIAECKFTDPRQANPGIGNRLGRIILRAMAAEPADRFPNVGEMVIALEGYLEESGVAADKVQSELSRYFQGPAAYEQAFETRLIEHLTTRGSNLLASNERAQALDVFDRVLTIDPDNEKVVGILDGINRRRRIQQMALGAVAIGVMGFCAYMIHRKNLPIEDDTITPPGGSTIVFAPLPDRTTVKDQVWDPPPPEDAGLVEPADGGAGSANTGSGSTLKDAGVVEPAIDAPPVATPTQLTVKVSPRNAKIQLGNGPWQDATDGKLVLAVERETVVRAKHPQCAEQEMPLRAGQTEVVFELLFRPAAVTPICKRPDVLDVRIADSSGKPYSSSLGNQTQIPFGKTTSDEKVLKIEFVRDKGQDPIVKTKRVTPTDNVEVSCD